MLEPGIQAPDFSLVDQSGIGHKLSDFRGKWVVLYFYPKDMTPGCTTEACNFRDEISNFTKRETIILGVSKDSISRHEKFARKFDLPFPLLSDEEGVVCKLFDVWKKKSLYGKSYMGIVRSTFVINPEGKIAHIFTKVNVEEHAAELLTLLDKLQ